MPSARVPGQILLNTARVATGKDIHGGMLQAQASEVKIASPSSTDWNCFKSFSILDSLLLTREAVS